MSKSPFRKVANTLVKLFGPDFGDDSIMARIKAFNEAMVSGNLRSIVACADEIIGHPRFEALPVYDRWPIYYEKGAALDALGALEEAREALRRAYDIAPPARKPEVAMRLIYVEADVANWAGAADLILALHDMKSASVENIDSSTLCRVLDGLWATRMPALKERLLEIACALPNPSKQGEYNDWILVRRLDQLADKKEYTQALELLKSIPNAYARIELRTRARYQDLWDQPGFDDISDPVAGHREDQMRRGKQFRPNPAGGFDPVIRAQDVFSMAGDFDTAIRIGSDFFDHLGQSYLADRNRNQAHWPMAQHAYALYGAGRTAEANSWLARAADTMPGGQINVAQTINFAAMLLAQSKPDDALEELKRVDRGNPSPYGLQWARCLRACAFHQLDDASDCDLLMHELLDNWHDNAAAYQLALVARGESDHATDLLIERLESSQHMPLALENIQNRPSMFEGTDVSWIAEMRSDFLALAEQDEVIKAVEAVGRIERYDTLAVTYWGTF